MQELMSNFVIKCKNQSKGCNKELESNLMAKHILSDCRFEEGNDF